MGTLTARGPDREVPYEPLVRRGPLVARIELFFASFAPLFALLAWRLSDRLWFYPMLLAAGFGVLVFLLVLVGGRRRAPDPFTFDSVVDLGDQVAGLLVGYLVPLLLPRSATNEDIGISIGVISVLALILIQANRIHLNPLFYILGWRVYSCTAGQSSYYLAARSDLADASGPIHAVEVSRGLLVERKRR